MLLTIVNHFDPGVRKKRYNKQERDQKNYEQRFSRDTILSRNAADKPV